jgi:hypothetical protein
MNMSKSADLTEIMGKNAVIGQMAQNVNAVEAEVFIASKKAKQAQGESMSIQFRMDLLEAEHRRTLLELEKTKKEVQERDTQLAEWMFSHEVLKIITKTYGKDLNMSDEQRLSTYDETIIKVADEKPEYKNTKLYKKVLVAKTEK